MSKRGKRNGHRPSAVVLDETPDDGPIPAVRHLAYTHGAPERHNGHMALLDENDEVFYRYHDCPAMFNRVQHDGRWYRLQGQDRVTGECVYTPEVT